MERETEPSFRAAMAAAADAGLPTQDPHVLHERSSLLVHLRPAPVVVRVALRTSQVRHGDAWYAREVAVATHLAKAGAPVVAPSAEVDPGPHERDGRILTFWEHAQPVEAPVDAEAAGRGLRDCHEALQDFEGDLWPLGLLHEAEAIAAARGSAEDARVADAVRAARERIEALTLPMQPVHGDGDLHNVIQTARGPLWNDWEDVHLAPVAWDLGCLHAGARLWDEDPAEADAAQRGYGPRPPDDVLDAFVEARRAQIDAWLPIYPE
jgi:hypothetical protein